MRRPKLKRKQAGVYNPVSRNIKQPVDFLQYPMFIPARKPGRKYLYEDDDRSVTVRVPKEVAIQNPDGFIDGTYTISGLPMSYDMNIFYAFMSRVQNVKPNVWTAEFETGQEILDFIGKKGRMNNAEADRIADALIKWQGFGIQFDGAFYDHKTKKRFEDVRRFSIVNHVHMRRTDTGWYFFVDFDRHFMTEILEGLSATVDLGVFFRLRAPFAKRLFQWLSANMAYQYDTKIGLGKLLDKLGDNTTQKPSRAKRMINDAIEEINRQRPRNGRRYRVEFDQRDIAYFTKYTKRKRLPNAA